MIGHSSFGMTVSTPAETFEDMCERLRRVAMDGGNALDIAEALRELTALRLLDQLPEFISVKDRRGRFVFTNQAVCRAAGIDDFSDLSGKTDFDVFEKDAADRLFAMEQQVMETGMAIERREEHLVRKDGRAFWLSISKSALRNGAGQIVGIVSVSREITERKRLEELRHGYARLLEMIARGKPLHAVLDALVTSAEAQLDDVRGSLMLMADDGQRLMEGAAPSMPKAYMALIDGAEIGASQGSCGTAAFRRETVIVRDIETDPLWEEHRHLGALFGFRSCWSTPVIGSDRRMLGTFALYSPTVREPNALELELMTMATDLAGIAIERAETESRIRHMAHHDPLTGLPNRTLFWAELGPKLLEARRENRRLTVAYLDLDNFKSINDTLGHAAGDLMLRTLAERIAFSVRPGDLTVRLGGDEFAVVFADDDEDESGALGRLEELRRLVAAPVMLAGTSVVATCSMGVAFFPEDGELVDELLASADHAMYHSKECGRDRLTVSA